MNDTRTDLKDVLLRFEQGDKPYSEHEIESALEKLRHEIKGRGDNPSEELQAEEMAFGFWEDYSNTDTGWGLYFGPKWVFSGDDGRIGEWPSIRCVNPQMLSYWAMRAKEAGHPILRTRYASLVWDFSRHVTGQNADPEMARIVIDATADIAHRDCHKYVKSVITKLERALALSLSLNDGDRVRQICDTIMSYEKRHDSDGDTRVWGLTYDLLLANKGLPLSDSQKTKIIDDLEDKLQRTANASELSEVDAFAIKDIAIRLASYYRKMDKKGDVRRVLTKYGEAFLILVEKADALTASSWLRTIHSVYVDFGLKSDADAVAVRLREIGKKCKDELSAFSVPVKIPKEEMDKYVESIISDDFDGSMKRIAGSYIPKQCDVKDQIHDLSEKNPIMFDMPVVIQDDQGRPSAEVGSIMDDMDGRVVLQISQNMKFEAIFLRFVLQRLKEKYGVTGKKVVDYACKSPVFEEDRKVIIESGLNAYLRGEFIIALHLLIPQIENAVRKIIELNGGAIYRKHRTGCLVLKTFDEVLRDQLVINVLGEDAALYLQILFTDERGWNIRNIVCHGMMAADSFTAILADRVFHVMAILGQLRTKDT